MFPRVSLSAKYRMPKHIFDILLYSEYISAICQRKFQRGIASTYTHALPWQYTPPYAEARPSTVHLINVYHVRRHHTGTVHVHAYLSHTNSQPDRSPRLSIGPLVSNLVGHRENLVPMSHAMASKAALHQWNRVGRHCTRSVLRLVQLSP